MGFPTRKPMHLPSFLSYIPLKHVHSGIPAMPIIYAQQAISLLNALLSVDWRKWFCFSASRASC
uniref:Xylose isomerase-like n=1 Tax=Rhizophora mucronata TaxID=61149 RepID=A0A2P2MFL9_RHIMU